MKIKSPKYFFNSTFSMKIVIIILSKALQPVVTRVYLIQKTSQFYCMQSTRATNNVLWFWCVFYEK
jgi:hypothetical protein